MSKTVIDMAREAGMIYREFVGLTDDELNDLTAIYSGMPLYREIEAKLRSNNT